jgi:hypothetical protein
LSSPFSDEAEFLLKKAAEREDIWLGKHKSSQICNDFITVLLVIYYMRGKPAGSLAKL